MLPFGFVDTSPKSLYQKLTRQIRPTGDSRVNEFIGLTNMNQIWMREHNRVSDFFIKINGHWDDERLFQESRRVVIAEMQHVVYNEFVPLLIGT